VVRIKKLLSFPRREEFIKLYVKNAKIQILVNGERNNLRELKNTLTKME
jgi:acylphosphatase